MKAKGTPKADQDLAKACGWSRFQMAMRGVHGGSRSASVLRRDYGTFTKETWKKLLRGYQKRCAKEEKERVAEEEERSRQKGWASFLSFRHVPLLFTFFHS